MSCSSKRNNDIGSCNSTFVSSTKSLVGPLRAALRARVGVRSAAGCVATGAIATGAMGAEFIEATGVLRGASLAALLVTPGSAAADLFAGASSVCCNGRLVLRTVAAKALGGSRSAGFVGAGGRGMGMAHEKERSVSVHSKSKKATLTQGGFLSARGCDVQRHWIIMHEPCDTTVPQCVKTTVSIRPPFSAPSLP